MICMPSLQRQIYSLPVCTSTAIKTGSTLWGTNKGLGDKHVQMLHLTTSQPPALH